MTPTDSSIEITRKITIKISTLAFWLPSGQINYNYQ
jgi:hypothetical protein